MRKKLLLDVSRLTVFPVVDLWDIVQLPDGREVATIISQEGNGWQWRVVRYMPKHAADDWTVLGYGPAASEVRAKEAAADFREMLHLMGLEEALE